jgi:hypothetical protein
VLGVMLAAMALLVAPSMVLAWNHSGHCIVDELTLRNLRPDVRAKLELIILHHPRVKQDLERGRPVDMDAGEYAFVRAGTWPDIVRDKANPMSAVYNKPIWHYSDAPYYPEGGEEKYTIETPKDIKPGEPYDSLSAWTYNLARLSDAKLPLSERAIALTWVLHLGGDMHQPLHNVSLYSPRFPKGDKGGNEWLYMEGPSIKPLHAVWDTMLGNDLTVDFIERRADQIMAEWPREKLSTEIAQHDQREWNREGRALAIKYVYLDGKLEGVSKDEAVKDLALPIPQISYRYKKTSMPVAERQAALAGYRIAEILNSVPLDIPETPVADPLATISPAPAGYDPTTQPFAEVNFPPYTRERLMASTRRAAEDAATKPTTRPTTRPSDK